MSPLSKSEVWNSSINFILEQNRYWKNGIQELDQRWTLEALKNTDSNFVKFINKHYPDLRYQFNWIEMTPNERLQEKFRFRMPSIQRQGFSNGSTYKGYYDAPNYEED
jgi:hypothetical protein